MTPTAVLSIRRELKRRAPGLDRALGDVLIGDAHRLLDACGVVRSHAWVRRIVRDYTASSVTGLPFGAYLLNRVELNAEQRRAALNDPEVAYLLEYADPVGEQAVRNVIQERGF